MKLQLLSLLPALLALAIEKNTASESTEIAAGKPQTFDEKFSQLSQEESEDDFQMEIDTLHANGRSNHEVTLQREPVHESKALLTDLASNITTSNEAFEEKDSADSKEKLPETLVSDPTSIGEIGEIAQAEKEVADFDSKLSTEKSNLLNVSVSHAPEVPQETSTVSFSGDMGQPSSLENAEAEIRDDVHFDHDPIKSKPTLEDMHIPEDAIEKKSNETSSKPVKGDPLQQVEAIKNITIAAIIPSPKNGTAKVQPTKPKSGSKLSGSLFDVILATPETSLLAKLIQERPKLVQILKTKRVTLFAPLNDSIKKMASEHPNLPFDAITDVPI